MEFMFDNMAVVDGLNEEQKADLEAQINTKEYPIVRQFVPQDRQANEKSCKAHTLIFSSTNNLLLH